MAKTPAPQTPQQGDASTNSQQQGQAAPTPQQGGAKPVIRDWAAF